MKAFANGSCTVDRICSTRPWHSTRCCLSCANTANSTSGKHRLLVPRLVRDVEDDLEAAAVFCRCLLFVCVVQKPLDVSIASMLY